MDVKVSNLQVAYSGNVAVKDVSLTIHDGESVVLLGQSGCGKTTTMRSIAGLETPTLGKITIGDKTVFDGERGKLVPAYKRNVGMVFQSYAVWPHKTVLENVAFPLKMRGLSKREQRSVASDVLDSVGLGHLGHRGASMLSGGQMQRVALARSLAMSPSVLLLDEPLSNLDSRLRDDLRIELRRLQVERGLTTLYVTHDQHEALALADRIAIMQDGCITQFGSPSEIYGLPANASIASFLGVTNVFSVDQRTDARRVKLSDYEIVLQSVGTIPTDRASACIRPENIEVTPSGSVRTGNDQVNVFPGTLDVAVYQGSTVRCRVSLASGLILDAVCPVSSIAAIGPGSAVDVHIDPEDIMLLADDAQAAAVENEASSVREEVVV